MIEKKVNEKSLKHYKFDSIIAKKWLISKTSAGFIKKKYATTKSVIYKIAQNWMAIFIFGT